MYDVHPVLITARPPWCAGGGAMVLTLRNSCRGPGCATKILTLFQTIQYPYLAVAF